MYRLLEVGEVIEKGDEFWMNSTRKWVIASYSVGARVKSCDGPQRRLVKPDVTPIPCKADPWHVSNCHSTPAASSVPDPGEGYRLLKPDELVEKGDEFLHTNGKWIKSHNWQEKHPKQGEQCDIVAYRRKLPAQPAVDPGEGWRLLEPDETIQKDDRYFDSGSWIVPAESVGKTVREAMKAWPSVIQAVRRRAGKPAPVVSVGDRVKVLSGPWAGCTGVVIALDAYVLLSDYGKMTAKYDSTPVIELEHVRVGGDKLILSKVTVERLPPVVPEVLYRDLSHGETIRKGDEIQMTKQGKWESVGSSAGTKVGNNHSDGRLYFFRRPVRLQSPGWRYLDAGETVQAGDEAAFHTEPIWRPALEHFSEGYAVRGLDKEHSETFRRKLPANQGG